MKGYKRQQYSLCYHRLTIQNDNQNKVELMFFTRTEKYTLLEYIESSVNKGN